MVRCGRRVGRVDGLHRDKVPICRGLPQVIGMVGVSCGAHGASGPDELMGLDTKKGRSVEGSLSHCLFSSEWPAVRGSLARVRHGEATEAKASGARVDDGV